MLKFFGNMVKTFPSTVKRLDVHVPVDHDQLLAMEQKGEAYRASSKGAPNYPIPQEVPLTGDQSHGMKGEWFEPVSSLSAPPSTPRKRKVILYMHGGGFVFLHPVMYRHMLGQLSADTDYSVFAVSYRLAPEHPFPACIHDAFLAYLWLLNPHHSIFGNGQVGVHHEGYKPEDIIIVGDSAGGGLAMSFLIYLDRYLRNEDGAMMFPFPGAGILLSPWMDLSFSTKSLRENTKYNYLPANLWDLHQPILPNMHHPVYSYLFGSNPNRALPFVGDAAEKGISRQRSDSAVELEQKIMPKSYEPVKDIIDQYVRHPLISPMFAESFEGFPPLMIVSGEVEMFIDENTATAKKMESVKTDTTWVRYEVYRDMFHDLTPVFVLPESQAVMKRIGDFLNVMETTRDPLDLPQGDTATYMLNPHMDC